MIDEITPSFITRRRKGDIIMNPCESWRSEVTRNGSLDYSLASRNATSGALLGATATRYDGRSTSQIRYPYTPMAAGSSVDRVAFREAFGLTSSKMQSLEQLALARVLERATSPKVMGLVTLAELDKTVDLIKSCAKSVNAGATLLESLGPKRLRELNTALSRIGRLGTKGKIKLFLRSLDSGLSNLCRKWLGYRYGVMATVYDVESWIEASSSKGRRHRVTSPVTDQFDSDTGEVVAYANWHSTLYWPNTGPFITRTIRRRRSVVRAGVILSSEAEGMADTLGLNRVASSAWELVPFSFVLDWLCDVGTRLAAHEGSFLMRPLGTWVTHEHYLSFSHSYEWRPNSHTTGGVTYSASGSDRGTVVDSTLYRVRVANPPLSFVPQLDVNLNWKRITDSVALLKVGSSRLSAQLLKKL